MEVYKNLGGNSGVTHYEIGDDYIIVGFHDGGEYLYNYEKPGSEHVEKMKTLAESGKGLNTYINQYVKKNYALKIK